MQTRIRRAKVEDSAAIQTLIAGVSHYFLADAANKHGKKFFKTISIEALAAYIQDEKFIFLVAEVRGKLAGVLSIKDSRHLYHMFVAEELQKRGIATALWEKGKAMAMEAGNSGTFTLNATPYAVPVYKRWGFKPTGERLHKYGVDFVPMRLETGAHPR